MLGRTDHFESPSVKSITPVQLSIYTKKNQSVKIYKKAQSDFVPKLYRDGF